MSIKPCSPHKELTTLTTPLDLFKRTLRSKSQLFEWTHWLQANRKLHHCYLHWWPKQPCSYKLGVSSNGFYSDCHECQEIVFHAIAFRLRDALFLETCKTWIQGKKRWMGLSWDATLLWNGVFLVITTGKHISTCCFYVAMVVPETAEAVTNLGGIGRPAEHGGLSFGLYLMVHSSSATTTTACPRQWELITKLEKKSQ